jgi:uncharacterized protein YycO
LLKEHIVKSDNSLISPAPIMTACLYFSFPNTFLANSTAAYETETGTTGTIFNHLFKQAITFAKRAHSETDIADNAVSDLTLTDLRVIIHSFPLHQ